MVRWRSDQGEASKRGEEGSAGRPHPMVCWFHSKGAPGLSVPHTTHYPQARTLTELPGQWVSSDMDPPRV
jgi:hypothetical protein